MCQHICTGPVIIFGLSIGLLAALRFASQFRFIAMPPSMAASLEYESISRLAHRLEDRMESVRSAGRICSVDDLPLLFRGLEVMEAMLAHVARTGEAPDGDPALLAALEPSPEGDDTEKKALI